MEIEGNMFTKWHFGLPFEQVQAKVLGLIEEGWIPDSVLVTTLNSIWWEAARDTIKLIKGILPRPILY